MLLEKGTSKGVFVDKLRSVGLWVWENKERLILAAVVVALIVRLAAILSPPPLVEVKLPPRPAATPAGDSDAAVPEPDPLPAPPERVEPGPLVRANPFSVTGGGEIQERDRGQDGEDAPQFRLYDVRQGRGNRPDSATISVGRGRRTRVDEGEDFEDGKFRLERVDVQNESVEIWVESERRMQRVRVQ